MGQQRRILKKHVEQYTGIAGAFVHGITRLWSARITALTNTVALSKLRGREPLPRDDHPLWAVADELLSISPNEFDSYEYVTNMSQLVYATTIFDTFMSDTTRYLFLLYPSAVGDEQQVPFATVLSSTSTYDLVNAAVTKRVRDLGYLPFLGRIEALRSRFGLKLEVSASLTKDLEHYSGLRNVVIHDQSFYSMRLGKRGQVVVSREKCALHPTPVASSDIKVAVHAYSQVAETVIYAIATQVFRRQSTKDLQAICSLLTGTQRGARSSDRGPGAGPKGKEVAST